MILLGLNRRYGLIGMFRLIRDILFSRLLYRGVRVIRYPWYFRGRPYIEFGKGFTSGVGLRMDAFGKENRQIVIGKGVQVGDYVHIAAMTSVTIGDHVLMASKIYISDHDHGFYGAGVNASLPCDIQQERPLYVSPVKIGRNVWVGENVCILKGVEIGENSIIGAGAVVTKTIPADAIVVGNPGRVVKRFDHSSGSWIGCGT